MHPGGYKTPRFVSRRVRGSTPAAKLGTFRLASGLTHSRAGLLYAGLCYSRSARVNPCYYGSSIRQVTAVWGTMRCTTYVT